MPELTLRDGMVIVGSLLILAVMVDAWRRMQQQRTRVRLKLAEAPPEDGGPEDDISMYRELPNGGARVVSRNEYAGPDDGPHDGPHDDPHDDPHDGPGDDPDDELYGDKEPRDVHERPSSTITAAEAPSPAPAKVASRAASTAVSAVAAPRAAPKSDAIDAPESEEVVEDAATTASSDTPDIPEQSSVMAGVSASDDEPANLDWLVDLPPAQEDPQADGVELPGDLSTEVIMLHVMARDELGFSGKSILEILLACDLRFGDMSFFHRHEQEAGRGPIQFSVANMLQPGVFDIDNMDQLRTRGLVFFLTLPGPEDMIQAFDYMLETARAVARNLNGELLDESRSVLTQQCVEHLRQQIREFERRLLAQPSA